MRVDRSPRLRPRASASLRLLEALLDLAGGQARLLRHTERDWASATFSGSRHRVDLAFRGNAGMAAAEQFIAVLPDHEFTLPGQIVADAVIASVDHRVLPEPELSLTCEVLLLAED